MKKSTFMTSSRTRSTLAFARIVSPMIAIGPHAIFQEALKSFIEDGMWDMVSDAKSSNPPLSKGLLMQTHEPEEDHWGKNDDEHHEDTGSEGEEDSN